MYTPCLGREVAPVQGWKLAVPMPSRFEPSASPHRSRPPRGPAGITWPMRQLTANLGLGLAAYVRFSFCPWGTPPPKYVSFPNYIGFRGSSQGRRALSHVCKRCCCQRNGVVRFGTEVFRSQAYSTRS